jgi:hypothetical protein
LPESKAALMNSDAVKNGPAAIAAAWAENVNPNLAAIADAASAGTPADAPKLKKPESNSRRVQRLAFKADKFMTVLLQEGFVKNHDDLAGLDRFIDYAYVVCVFVCVSLFVLDLPCV